MNTREEWLNSALPLVRELLPALPVSIRVSCGFPAANVRKAIGQCWSETNSADSHAEIFISPVLANPIKVLETLVHECVHAAVGVKHGHKAVFKHAALAVGLTGKMTATVAGEALIARLNIWIDQLGVYPHATLSLAGQTKKQTTRLVKCQCAGCGYVVRTTQKWIDSAGAPLCPTCFDTDEENEGNMLRMTVEKTDEEEGE